MVTLHIITKCAFTPKRELAKVCVQMSVSMHVRLGEVTETWEWRLRKKNEIV